MSHRVIPLQTERFRVAAPSDADAVVSLMRTYYAEEGYSFQAEEMATCVSRFLKNPALGRLWVADVDGQVVGYVVVTFGFSFEYGGRDAFIDELFVHETHRGKSLGRQAVTLAESFCRREGVRALHLEVESHRTQAAELYQRQGFSVNGRTLMTKKSIASADAATAGVGFAPAPEGMLVRGAAESDYDAVARALATWWDTPGFDTEAARRERAALVPRLWLQHFFDTSLVAEANGGLAGFVIGFFSSSRPDEAYIHFTGVHPDHRRAGVGRCLYERFFQQAQQAGRTQIRAITSPGNSRSVAFHQALGFEIEAGDVERDGVQVKIDYDGPGLDRIAMLKRLPPG